MVQQYEEIVDNVKKNEQLMLNHLQDIVQRRGKKHGTREYELLNVRLLVFKKERCVL